MIHQDLGQQTADDRRQQILSNFVQRSSCCLLFVLFPLPLVAAPLAEAVSADGRCRAVLSVSPDRPYLSDTMTLTLNVTCPEEETVEFPPFGEKMGELTIVDVKISDRQLILTAVARRSGKTPIWAMTIMCGQQRIDLPATELDIATTIDADTASLDNIGLKAELFPERSWHIYVLAALLVVAAVLILLWLLYGRKKAEVVEEITPLSAQELALRRLAALLESCQHESDVKGFFVELSDIVRWYVERLTGIRAPELTTEEFLDKIARPTNRLRSGLAQQSICPTGSLKLLVPFLESADIVKFAKHIPTTDEIMLAFRRAEQFVRKELAAESEEVVLLKK